MFPTYFSQMVAGPGSKGAEDWGFALGLSEGAVAILAPLFGAVADRSGRLKPWIGVTTLIVAVLIAGLWFVKPQETDVLLALVLVALANFAVELAIVFYNALLPRIAPADMVGRLSGWGWATGYAGRIGRVALVFVSPHQGQPAAGLSRCGHGRTSARNRGPRCALAFSFSRCPFSSSSASRLAAAFRCVGPS